MKYYIIAGEASGDLHGSNLIKHLKLKDKNAQIHCWGGDKMQSEGAQLIKHYKDLSFMGFTEVAVNIRIILNNISFCKQDILSYKPDAVILIDYPGFNLRIAKFAKQNNIKVIYYISPQIWAWKQSRVKIIKANVDKMLVILPFEKDFYNRFNYAVDFVGHPLLDAIYDDTKQSSSINEFVNDNLLTGKPIVAVLPGSRKQEIKTMLPVMAKMAAKFPTHEFVVAAAPSISSLFYKEVIGNNPIKLVYDQTYRLLQYAVAGTITSGTATLETALFNLPEVVCYKGNKISYSIAKRLIKVKYISLVNLIMDKEIVKELIQDDFNEISLEAELNNLLHDNNVIKNMKQSYFELQQKLGGIGASEKAATIIYNYLHKL